MKKIIIIATVVVLIATIAISIAPMKAKADGVDLPVIGLQKEGDVNGDKTVDNKDVVTLFRYVSGGDIKIQTKVADLNKDKLIDNKDVVSLFRKVSQKK